MRMGVRLLLIIGLLAGGLGGSWLQAAGNGDTIAQVEPEVLERLRETGSVQVLVFMEEQPDLSAAYAIDDWVERGRYVYDTLLATTQQSQAPVVAFAAQNGLSFRSLYSVNAVSLQVRSERTVALLARLPGVALIRPVQSYPLDPAVESAELVDPDWNLGALDPAGGDYGMQAKDVWSSLNVRGEGVVVGSIDTGVRYTHEALIRQYRGYQEGEAPVHDYNWYQAADGGCGDGSEPCDSTGHGTMTLGLVVGEDVTLTHQIGVAPAAGWIACSAWSSAGLADDNLIACADWMLAPCPIGQEPGDSGCDPDLRPQIINNSWGGDGLYSGGDMWFEGYVEAWRAAGIFPAFSAGNADNNADVVVRCQWLSSPGDYSTSFASSSHFSDGENHYGGGPSTAAGATHLVKPNVSAPSGVFSSSRLGDDTYGGINGTSAASPHTAGAVALCWSANPALVGNLEQTAYLVEQTARDTLTVGDCGLVPWVPPPGGNHQNTPNDEFGWGYLDALALVEACAAGVAGYVRDQETGDPLLGAIVRSVPGEYQTSSQVDGYYKVMVSPGEYQFEVGAPGYYTHTTDLFSFDTGEWVQQDVALAPGWRVEDSDLPELNRFDGVFVPGPEAEPWANRVYFMGGDTGSGGEDTSIWSFEPYSGVYTDTGFSMVEGVADYTAVLVDSDPSCNTAGPAIYVVGGTDSETGLAVDLVQRFCVADGIGVQLVTSDPWPGQLGGVSTLPGGVGVVDGQIYVMGGLQSEQAPVQLSDSTYRYDPQETAGARWTDLNRPLSEAKAHLVVAVVESKLYALGGVIEVITSPLSMESSQSAEVLDTADLAAGWQPIADLPSPSMGGRAIGLDRETLAGWAQYSTGGRILLLGGGAWPERDNQVPVYSIAENAWQEDFPPLHEARRYQAAVLVPLCSPDRSDGVPGVWVWGGDVSGEEPPFGPAEQFSFHCYPVRLYLPVIAADR